MAAVLPALQLLLDLELDGRVSQLRTLATAALGTLAAQRQIRSPTQ
jgi:hypothetical protein